MITLSNNDRFQLCNRVTRRNVMQIGALGFGFGALGLPDLLRAEPPTAKPRHKALVNIFLGGGPPHQDRSSTPQASHSHSWKTICRFPKSFELASGRRQPPGEEILKHKPGG